MEVLLRYYQKMSFMSVLVFGTNNNFFVDTYTVAALAVIGIW